MKPDYPKTSPIQRATVALASLLITMAVVLANLHLAQYEDANAGRQAVAGMQNAQAQGIVKA